MSACVHVCDALVQLMTLPLLIIISATYYCFIIEVEFTITNNTDYTINLKCKQSCGGCTKIGKSSLEKDESTTFGFDEVMSCNFKICG